MFALACKSQHTSEELNLAPGAFSLVLCPALFPGIGKFKKVKSRDAIDVWSRAIRSPAAICGDGSAAFYLSPNEAGRQIPSANLIYPAERPPRHRPYQER